MAETVNRPRPGAVLPPAYDITQMCLTPIAWRAVFWTGQAHRTERIHVLALATNAASSDPAVQLSLIYDLAGSWRAAEDDPAFCGLLLPEVDLSMFEAVNPCGHTPGP